GIKALYEGRIPESLNFFLYESIDESVETAMKKTLMDTIKGGGFIGLIIIFLGFASLVLIILRTVLLVQSGRGVTEDIELLAASVEKRDWKAAGEFAGKTEGSLSRVLIATVNALKTDPEKADDTIAESIMNEQPRLDRYRIPLSVFAAVSPLLGLLGTVTGMIATFDIITVYGTGDPKLLSGGISEALITTMFGLIVAIPVLLVGNLLSSRAASITSALEVKALRLVNAFPGKESR
ncbi:MAG: MotA/TolQ/ExbB proton channel family protein, partial [Spirochaetales bacterium]|nr:MotA/TolQ/ExbB proton channel family protein [Spirochaetales bacterium]